MHEEIRLTIDNELVCDILSANGWTRVNLTRVNKQKYDLIQEWMHTNIQHKYRGYYENWVFESKQDAALFNLTWG